MARLSDEQIERARNVDLLLYLQTYEPHTIKKCSANEYCLVEHNSFKMSNGKWFWHSQGYGGNSLLDYLVKVRGMDFVTAVQTATRETTTPLYKEQPLLEVHLPPKPKKPFALPKANVNNHRVYAYLCGRGIGKEIINRCIREGILYESANTHRCVFVGKDGDTPKFACERGTDNGTKKDVWGSDKRFGFHLSPESPDSRNLVITESPIDSMAHYCIHEIGQTGFDGYRLSLAGVSSPALMNFLERNPQIQNVYLALDNDKAGLDATNRIINELLSDKRFAQMKIIAAPPPNGCKDYADVLQAIHKLNEKLKPDRRRAVVSI